jgi:energy-coupling factor transport system permease protein
VTGAARLPRDLHPVAWWVWALGLAVAASFTTNPLLLLTLVAVATTVVMMRRSDQPWARSFRIYAAIAAVIVVMRVLFRVLLGDGGAGTVVLDLWEVPLPDWVLGIHLLGPVTREALLSGLYDGLRLGTIVICVGAGNALANPKRLLRSVPAALHEIGTALVVAVTVVPQLAESVRRVRAAQALRAGDISRWGRLRRFLVPVLEDALERSLRLAAGMDTRGYGRSAGATPSQRRVTGGLMLGGLIGVCVGVYAVLDRTAPRVLAVPMLALGVLAAVAGLAMAGRRVVRSSYRPDSWRWPELVVIGSGTATAVVAWWVSQHDLLIAYPGLSSMPEASGVALGGALLGLVAGVAAPEPRMVLA